MPITSDQDGFWDRVEHEMKVTQPGVWRTTMILLRLGMVTILFAVSYVMFFSILAPSKGYFFVKAEMVVSPYFWLPMGVTFIIAGAYLRFRAMGPIIEHLKQHGLE